MPLVTAAATFSGDTRYALSDTHLQTLGLGGEREGKKKKKKRKERKREKNGREAEIGQGEGDRLEKVRGIFIRGYTRGVRRTNAHERMHVRRIAYARAVSHDVACAGACKKIKKEGARNCTRASERTRGSLSSRVNATRRCVALIDTNPARLTVITDAAVETVDLFVIANIDSMAQSIYELPPEILSIAVTAA